MDRKWVHLVFACIGIILMFVFGLSFEWAWSSVGRPNTMVIYGLSGALALLFTVLAWLNQRIFSFLNDSLLELAKVSWPAGKDTAIAVVVVAATVVIAALFLGVFDKLGSVVANWLYGTPGSG